MKTRLQIILAPFFLLTLLLTLLTTLLIPTTPAVATPTKSIPPELAPWVEWVRERNPKGDCPRVKGARECMWPGVASLKVGQFGATFTIKATVFHEDSLPLPSRSQIPAFDVLVSVSGKPIKEYSLYREGDVDYVKVPAGEVLVSGKLKWGEMPRELPMPPIYGLTDVQFDPSLVGYQAIREASGVRLEPLSGEIKDVPDSLDWGIYRRIEDGSPINVQTVIQLRVSGRARSHEFGVVLPDGAVPVSFVSPLPSHIDESGKLSVQLTPGSYTLKIDSQIGQPVAAIKLPNRQGKIWPSREIISWYPQPNFRTVDISGGTPIFTELRDMPNEWKNGSIFSVDPLGELKLKEIRRGEQAQGRNQLSIQREFWVPQNGGELTVRDTLTGRVTQDRRLNALASLDIGRISIRGQPWLITADPESKREGAEIREESINLEAISLLSSSGSIPLTGWLTPLETVSITLHTPPSWGFLYASGIKAGVNTGSWVDSWTLLSFFCVVLIAIATRALLGNIAALITLGTYVLGHQEFLFPSTLFLYVLGFLLWFKLVGTTNNIWGRISKFCISSTAIIWMLHSLTYAKLQFTQALFPQLQSGTRHRTMLQSFLSGLDSSFLSWPTILGIVILAMIAIEITSSAKTPIGKIFRFIVSGAFIFTLVVITVIWHTATNSRFFNDEALVSMAGRANSLAPQRKMSSSYEYGESYEAQAKDAAKEQNVTDLFGGKTPQAGAAVPTWTWRSFRFAIPGPINPESMFSVVLIPPNISRLLCLVRLFLIGFLIYIVGKSTSKYLELKWNGSEGEPNGTAFKSVVSILLALVLTVPSIAKADFPDSGILSELQKRLEEGQCSRAECSQIDEIVFTPKGDVLQMQMKVVSDGVSAVALPGPYVVLPPKKIEVQGRETNALRVNASGYIEAVVPDGVSQINVTYEAKQTNLFTVQFVSQPRLVRLDSADWIAEGITPSGESKSSIRLLRKGEGNAIETETTKNAKVTLPSWILVNRNIVVGERIEVDTTVTRIGQSETDETVELPPLAGEQLTTASARTSDEKILVHFKEGQKTAYFQSQAQLQKSSLKLVAATQPRLSETWSVSCQAFLSCDVSGATPLRSTVGGQKIWEWVPFPNESATITRKALVGKSGAPVTVDGVRHELRSATSSFEGSLNLNVRATAQSELSVGLPTGITVDSFSLDNVSGIGTKTSDSVAWLLSPGVHNISIVYSKIRNEQLFDTPPLFTVSSKSYNVKTTWKPDHNRWLIWTGGGLWGPSVVFWSKMAIIVITCGALSSFGLLPLSILGGCILGAGLSTLPVVFLSIPLLWLILLKLHSTNKFELTRMPRALHVLSAFILTGLSMLTFYSIVETGLVNTPPMLIAGNGSSIYNLIWFHDVVSSALPQPYILSLPMWVWRGISLLWSTWLVMRIVALFPAIIGIFRDKRG
jgi:hypothetical protein